VENVITGITAMGQLIFGLQDTRLWSLAVL